MDKSPVQMKVLFVSSGNSKEGISVLVKNQGESLIKSGVDISYFTIKGKGINGYLKNLYALRKNLKENKFDIIHAHYSLSGFVAALAGASPLVVSLMGSDIKANIYIKYFIRFFHRHFWDFTVVKSLDMKENLRFKNIIVLPNGVNLSAFKPCDKNTALKELNWGIAKRHILFGSDPDRREKNFQLFFDSFGLLKDQSNLEFHTLINVPHNQIPIYLNAADVLILSSLWEGSPNIIKEAMACNCPIVATDVGDIRWVLGDTKGCFITTFEPVYVAQKIEFAIEFREKYGQTKGRDRIIQLGLDSKSVAGRIVDIYKKVLNS